MLSLKGSHLHNPVVPHMLLDFTNHLSMSYHAINNILANTDISDCCQVRMVYQGAMHHRVEECSCLKLLTSGK